MSIILNLIEERNNQLLDFDVKKEQRDNLVAQIKALNEEIESFDQTKVLSEIDELTECAKKLGLLSPVPTSETENPVSTETINTQEI